MTRITLYGRGGAGLPAVDELAEAGEGEGGVEGVTVVTQGHAGGARRRRSGRSELEYFTPLAEELLFGRAAQRLGDRSVRAAEGGTAAGEAPPRLACVPAVGAAAEKARRAGERQTRLRLVMKPGEGADLLSGTLAAYAGRVDVAPLYVSFDDLTALGHETLWGEGRVAVLPPEHRLAGRGEVTFAVDAGRRPDAGPAGGGGRTPRHRPPGPPRGPYPPVPQPHPGRTASMPSPPPGCRHRHVPPADDRRRCVRGLSGSCSERSAPTP